MFTLIFGAVNTKFVYIFIFYILLVMVLLLVNYLLSSFLNQANNYQFRRAFYDPYQFGNRGFSGRPYFTVNLIITYLFFFALLDLELLLLYPATILNYHQFHDSAPFILLLIFLLTFCLLVEIYYDIFNAPKKRLK